MVAKIGLNLIFDSIKELVDTSLPPKLVSEIRKAIMTIDGVEGIHLLRTRQMGEDALIDAHIVVDPRITVSEGHTIGDTVRDELISRFDDIMDVLVHVDPEDDEGLFEKNKPLKRGEVKRLIDKYMSDFKDSIIDFKIHYLNGLIELELILPFVVTTQPEIMVKLNKQSRRMEQRVRKIKNITLFFKQNEG